MLISVRSIRFDSSETASREASPRILRLSSLAVGPRLTLHQQTRVWTFPGVTCRFGNILRIILLGDHSCFCFWPIFLSYVCMHIEIASKYNSNNTQHFYHEKRGFFDFGPNHLISFFFSSSIVGMTSARWEDSWHHLGRGHYTRASTTKFEHQSSATLPEAPAHHDLHVDAGIETFWYGLRGLSLGPTRWFISHCPF